jgi:hypothetical protein
VAYAPSKKITQIKKIIAQTDGARRGETRRRKCLNFDLCDLNDFF